MLLCFFVAGIYLCQGGGFCVVSLGIGKGCCFFSVNTVFLWVNECFLCGFFDVEFSFIRDGVYAGGGVYLHSFWLKESRLRV